MSRTAARTAPVVLVLAAFAVGWVVFAPPQLGGSTRYVILAGSSMEPSLREGDLALVRPLGDVETSDVVLYRDPQLRAHVLHRVVRIEDGRYVLKGDNNSYLDGVRPTADEVSGELWFSVPRAGSAVEWVRKPVHAALIVFVLAFLAFGGGTVLTTRQRSPELGIVPVPTAKSRAPESPGAAAHAALTLGLVGLAVFGLLALASHSRPVSRSETIPDAYAHTGTFSYSALVPVSDVYPDGRVDTGESAFLRLVPALDIEFAYRLAGQEAADVRGDVSLAAVLSDGAGWVREIPFGDTRSFTGSSVRASGRLDLGELSAVVEEMRALTGSGTTTFSLHVVPKVDVRGLVGAEPLDETFSPSFSLLLDPVSVRPDASGETPSPYVARRTEGVTASVPGYVELGGMHLEVEDARRVSVLALIVAGLVVAVAAAALWRKRAGGEPARIASRFGDRMLTVAGPPGVDCSRVTDLADVESLHRVAERYDRVVLHWRDGLGHVYLVDDGSAVYRYRSGSAARADKAVDPDLEETLVLKAAQLPPRAGSVR